MRPVRCAWTVIGPGVRCLWLHLGTGSGNQNSKTKKRGRGESEKEREEREGVRSDSTVPAPPNERKTKEPTENLGGEFLVVRRSGRVSERSLVPFHHLHAFLCVCASKNTRILGIRVYTRRFPIRKVMWRDNLHGRLR